MLYQHKNCRFVYSTGKEWIENVREWWCYNGIFFMYRKNAIHVLHEAPFKWMNILYQTIYVCCINRRKANTKENWIWNDWKKSLENIQFRSTFVVVDNNGIEYLEKNFIFGAVLKRNTGSISSNGLFCLKIITVKNNNCKDKKN